MVKSHNVTYQGTQLLLEKLSDRVTALRSLCVRFPFKKSVRGARTLVNNLFGTVKGSWMWSRSPSKYVHSLSFIDIQESVFIVSKDLPRPHITYIRKCQLRGTGFRALQDGCPVPTHCRPSSHHSSLSSQLVGMSVHSPVHSSHCLAHSWNVPRHLAFLTLPLASPDQILPPWWKSPWNLGISALFNVAFLTFNYNYSHLFSNLFTWQCSEQGYYIYYSSLNSPNLAQYLSKCLWGSIRLYYI